VLGWRAETSSDEESTDLVAVKAHGVGLVVQARTPDVNCR
jgi:hypothetical protein